MTLEDDRLRVARVHDGILAFLFDVDDELVSRTESQARHVIGVKWFRRSLGRRPDREELPEREGLVRRRLDVNHPGGLRMHVQPVEARAQPAGVAWAADRVAGV